MVDTAVVISEAKPDFLENRVRSLEDRARVNTCVMVVLCVMVLLIGLFVWLK
jgi:hypothetical protein